MGSGRYRKKGSVSEWGDGRMLSNLSLKYRILPWGPQPFHKGLGEDCTARTTLKMRGGGLYKGILGESLQRRVVEDPQSLLIL